MNIKNPIQTVSKNCSYSSICIQTRMCVFFFKALTGFSSTILENNNIAGYFLKVHKSVFSPNLNDYLINKANYGDFTKIKAHLNCMTKEIRAFL